MKRITLILSLLAIGLFSYGQVDTTVVPFVAYWSPGDSHDFRVTKIKQRIQDGEMTKDDTTSYVANFNVMDSTANSYTISWTFQPDLSEFDIPKELTGTLKSYKKSEVIYTTTELGEFVEIENWEEVGSRFNEVISKLKDKLKDSDADSKKIEKAIAPLLKIYSSKQGIEQVVYTELQFFHFLFGLEYNVDKPIYYKEQYPNMFGGKPLKADAKLYVDEVDFENFYCKMVQEADINPDDVKKMINLVFKKMGLNDKEVKKMLKTATMDISDRNVYEFTYFPGVPNYIETTRKIEFDLGGSEDRKLNRTIIERIID